jgi:hypothetical protein
MAANILQVERSQSSCVLLSSSGLKTLGEKWMGTRGSASVPHQIHPKLLRFARHESRHLQQHKGNSKYKIGPCFVHYYTQLLRSVPDQVGKGNFNWTGSLARSQQLINLYSRDRQECYEPIQPISHSN